jgi:hypothetical protein
MVAMRVDLLTLSLHTKILSNTTDSHDGILQQEAGDSEAAAHVGVTSQVLAYRRILPTMRIVKIPGPQDFASLKRLKIIVFRTLC